MKQRRPAETGGQPNPGAGQFTRCGAKAAAQATCTQTLAEFCRDLGKAKESDPDPDNRYNDAIPVFQFVSSRMEDVLKNASENGAELPLLLQGGPTEFDTKN